MKKKLIILCILIGFIGGIAAVYFIMTSSDKDKDSSNKTTANESSSTNVSDNSSKKEETTYNDDGKDVVVKDEIFLAQMNDIFENVNNYLGRNITVEGIVQKIDDKHFAVARKYDESHGDHYDEIMVGIITSYGESLPSENQWVEVKGKIVKETVEGSEQPVIKAEEVKVKETKGQEKIYD